MSDEPVNWYVNDDNLTCTSIRCRKPATHLLVFRNKPDETFPQGLLTKAGYCWDDAIWFAGAQVAMYGATFIELVEVEEWETIVTAVRGR